MVDGSGRTFARDFGALKSMVIDMVFTILLLGWIGLADRWKPRISWKPFHGVFY
jgi:hypothetical protein